MSNHTKRKASLIESVTIQKLFGQFDYSIRLNEKLAPEHHLLLLYGDNGAGKSTILRLMFHLLNPEPYAAHRTSVARVPFGRIEIRLTCGTVVSAARDDPFNKSAYLLSVKGADGKVSVEWQWQEELASREHHSEEYDAYCQALANTGMAFRFLPDTRRVEGLPDDLRRRRAHRFHSVNLPERLGSDVVIADSTFAEPESLVEDAIKRTIGWLRHQALSASNVGYTSVNAIYAALIRQIVEKDQLVENDVSLSLDGLRQELLSLHTRNATFSRYGLTPELEINQITRLLNQASPAEVPLLNTVLRPYFDGHNARLDALQPVQKVIDEFVSMLSEFFAKKHISVDMAAGMTVSTSDNMRLDPDVLSSGEKQLLMLLCNTITARQDGTILIIDEPEISLNVKWQRGLVDALLTCLEGVQSQLILATHSIEILAQHRDFVASLEDTSE